VYNAPLNVNPTVRRAIAQRAAFLALVIGVLWFIRVLDAFRGFGSAAGHGVLPRSFGGLTGILTAPLIHSDFSHLIANTVPLTILGALILIRGIREFLFVTFVVVMVSGAGTWLFGESANHIGASGVVLGFTSYLIFRSAFDHRVGSFIVTVLVVIAYGTTLLFSFVPERGISWSLHFWGFVGGFIAARVRHPSQPDPSPQEVDNVVLTLLKPRKE